MAGNIIDRTIGYFAPQKALRRVQARKAMQYFDGATRGRRASGWRKVGGDANSTTLGQLGRLRDNSRDLIRNNGWAARGRDLIRANVVGAGILARVKCDDEETKKRLQGLVRRHFERTAIDADGMNTLGGLQALAISEIVESGEVIIRRRARRSTDGYPLPFQIQVLEGDHLDSTKNGPMPNGNLAIQGVEFDGRGRRVAYHLFDEHPGSVFGRLPVSRRIPAKNVIHAFRVDRAGQVRGVPWLAPVILRLRDWNEYIDAQLVRQKIAACYAGFITTDEDEVDFEDPDSEGGYPVEAFEPGMIERLSGGEGITFTEPPQVEGIADYSKVTLREIAAGLGVTYEALTGDLNGISFSGGRMGRLEFNRNNDQWQQHILIAQICHRIEAWFLAAATMTGDLSGDVIASMTWTPPRREQIDPVKEGLADERDVRGGFTSRSSKIRERGGDPEEVDLEIAEDNARADKAGLIFDTDPRLTTQQGLDPERDDNAAQPDA